MGIIAIIPYGSRVYGTHTDRSDYDFLILTTDNSTITDEAPLAVKDVDYKFLNVTSFQAALYEQDISVIEAYLTPPLFNDCIQPLFDFKVNPTLLRHSVSKKSSNSWVKCKKKLTVEEGQEDIGMKSMFHAFRMVNFSIQLVETGTIYDFSQANHFWKDIQEIGPDWQKLETIMKPKYNNILSEFRKVAPK